MHSDNLAKTLLRFEILSELFVKIVQFSLSDLHASFLITRFQGNGPNIHCFYRGFTHTVNQKVLLVKKYYFISSSILTKMFRSCESYMTF